MAMEVALTPNRSLERSASGGLRKYRLGRHRSALPHAALQRSSASASCARRSVRCIALPGRLRCPWLRPSSKLGSVVGSWSLSYRARMNPRPRPNPALNRTGRYRASFLGATARPAG